MLLAQNTTFIIGPIAKLLGIIINVIYEGLTYIGIENVALSIILFTVFVQVLMIPLKYKSQKFTRLTAMIQPEIAAIRKKYEGKRDQQTMSLMQQETNEVYRKYGASPTGGCLPMLVQMPILFALYAVIRNVPSYVQGIRGVYEQVAPFVSSEAGVKTLHGIKEVAGVNLQAGNTESVIDWLYNFNIADWQVLVKNVAEVPQAIVDKIVNISRVFGDVLVSDTPWSLIKANGYIHWIWILPILVYVTQMLAMKTAQAKNQMDGPGMNQMKMMNRIMPIMSVVFSIALPVGLGIYWITNSVLMTIQQIFMNRHIDKIGIENIIEKNVKKNESKHERAKEKKGVDSGTVKRAAALNTKSIKENGSTGTPETEQVPAAGTDSIGAIARLTDKYKNE
ncbi:MAG: YidC/Oxa1 family membrane protein insertase [Eubacteriales bacterium]|nr:YidC/Oxa1 family membrane protein insertase [Eubacteriales bacterium]